MPGVVWVGQEVDLPPPEQDGQEDKAVGEDQNRLARFNSVEEAIETRSLPSKLRQRPAHRE